MTVQTRTFPISRDSRIAVTGSTELGAGRSDGLPAGLYSGYLYRSLLAFTNDWSGMFAIQKIELRIRTSGQVHVAFGSSPTIKVQRVTSAWSEGTASVPMSGSNAVIWPGPSATGTNEATHNPGTAENSWRGIDITALYKTMAPPSLGGSSAANNGIRLVAANEGTGADTSEFWSRESGHGAAYILVTFENNRAPDTPTITSPANEALTNTAAGTDVVVSGTYSDPDGDLPAVIRVQVLADSATDAVPGAPIIDTTGVPPGATWSVYLGGLAARTYYRVRAQVEDVKGAWSGWSSVTAQRFKTNALPGTPVSPALDPGTLTPHFYASIQDADPGAYITAAQVLVYLDLGGSGTITKWDSGKLGIGGTSTRFDIGYAGAALDWETQYRAHFRIWDNDDQVSEWSAPLYFTQHEPTGPTTMTPNTTAVRQFTLTPTLYVGNSVAFDQWNYEVYAGINGDGSPAGAPIDSFTATVASTTGYPGDFAPSRAVSAGALAWGHIYYWRARIRQTGNANLGQWSPLAAFYVNALATAPTDLAPGGPSQSTQLTFLTLTPTLYARYQDVDLIPYGDTPYSRTIEISLSDSPFTVAHTDTATQPSLPYTDPMAYVVPGGALANETHYRVRWQFIDNVGLPASPWSAYSYFRTSLPPTVVLGANGPAEGSTVTDPTPLLDWLFTSPGGHARGPFRLRLTNVATGDLIYDTGLQPIVPLPYVDALLLPPYLLDTGITYSWTVDHYDDQGLLGTMAPHTFVTDFAVPPPPAGFIATPDPTTSSVALAWTAGAHGPFDPDIFDPTIFAPGGGLPPETFLEWRIYRRNQPDGQYDLIATLTDQAQITYVDFGAALDQPVAYRLTLHNGWRESTSDDATATLTTEAPGAWVLVVPEQDRYLLELPMVSAGPKTFEQPSERYVPLGRRNALVEHDAIRGASGSLSMVLPPEEWYLEGRLRELADWPDPCYLKNRYGDSWLVRLGTISSTPAPNGMQELTIAYQQVGA